MVLVLQGRATTHSNDECRIQLDTKASNGSATINFATLSRNPTFFGGRDPPSRYDPDRPCIAFTVVEAPTEEEEFWPFGLKN